MPRPLKGLPPAPKVDLKLKESLVFKKDERLDTQHGTPGMWIQNGNSAKLYIPGWLILAERIAKFYSQYPEQFPVGNGSVYSKAFVIGPHLRAQYKEVWKPLLEAAGV